jgi:membrane fusion protein, multidrug efflux system
MKRRGLVFGAVALVALAAVVATRSWWSPEGASAQAQRTAAPVRAVPVEVATAVKGPVPVRVDALGNVTPIASVAIKSRLETEITAVHFTDGALVKAGDPLFTLDSRTIEAQIRQAEGVLARDKAQLEGAERDVARYTELVAKRATPQINLDNAKTQADTFRANIRANQAALENFKVQLTYCTIRASITGRISAAAVKVGNFVRPSDTAPLATINQMAPVYVTFTVPQKILPDIRNALAAGTATVEVAIPGEQKRASGQVAMIENSVDTTTGMAIIRAAMQNEDERLWPGTLVTAELTLRTEEAVVVPSTAVQVSQTGTFVFLVKDGIAKVQHVKVERQMGLETVIASGLEGGETVVTEGQLLLSDGTRVNARAGKPTAGS